MAPEQKDFAENNELYEHHRFVADKGQSLIRIDKFLFDKLESISRSKIQAAAQAGSIIVNQNPVKSNYKVNPGILFLLFCLTLHGNLKLFRKISQ